MLINMALLYEGAQDLDKAKKCLDDAAKLDPVNEKIKGKISSLGEIIKAQVAVPVSKDLLKVKSEQV